MAVVSFVERRQTRLPCLLEGVPGYAVIGGLSRL